MIHLAGPANRILILFYASVLLLGGVVACKSPLDIDTPRIITPIDPDPGIINGSGDSINARVNGSKVTFGALVERPFHNGHFAAGHYLTVRAATHHANGDEYQVVSLRLDRVRDTGTYAINGEYSAPKSIDTTAPPIYGAAYVQKRSGSFAEHYLSSSRLGGEIRVTVIDTLRRNMIGTFWFRAYNADRDTIINVDQGVFRLSLDAQ